MVIITPKNGKTEAETVTENVTPRQLILAGRHLERRRFCRQTINKMNKILIIICATFILSLSISAQSGSGSLRGFVASSIKNGSAIDATVELRAIENWAKTKSVDTIQTKGGYYEI